MSQQDLRAALAVLADRQRGEHPAPDELLAYHLGELLPEAEEKLQAHLAHCPDCASALLDFDSFPETVADAGMPPVADHEVDQLSRAVRSALPARRAEIASLNSLRLARAASLVFLTSTLVLAGAVLRNAPPARPAAPSLNPLILELHPLDSRSTRAGRPAPAHRLDEEAGGALVVLVLAEADPFPEYQVMVASKAGEEVWKSRGLKRTPDGLLSFYLARESLPEGDYIIHLSGFRGHLSAAPLARFALHLQHD